MNKRDFPGRFALIVTVGVGLLATACGGGGGGGSSVIPEPTAAVTKTADPTSVPETGGDVTFTVRVTIILSLIGWTWLARQLRGQVLAVVVPEPNQLGPTQGDGVDQAGVYQSIGKYVIGLPHSLSDHASTADINRSVSPRTQSLASLKRMPRRRKKPIAPSEYDRGRIIP